VRFHKYDYNKESTQMPKSEDMDDITPPAAPAGGLTAAQKLAALRAGNSANPASPGSTAAVTPATPSYGSAVSSTTGGYGMGSTGYGASASPSTFGSAQSQQATGAMQEGSTTTLETSGGFGDFINSKWRPMMAVIYMITCTTDFVIFPILWSLLQALTHGNVTSQWQPLTLQGAGLYHIAMGAVLGLAAYGRSQEKIAGKA
jgi:hypothetical protein